MMQATYLRSALVLIALLTLGACASVERRPAPNVDDANRAALVLVRIPQQEIEVDKPDVGNGGGGLIGALIEGAAEAYMDKNRQTAIAPIRDALIDLNIAERAMDQLRGRISPRLVREDAKMVLVRSEDESNRILLDYNQQNVMLIDLRYSFQQDFRALYVQAWVGFGDYGTILNKKGVAVYDGNKSKDATRAWTQYQAQFPLSDSSGSYTPNIARWMADGGAPIRKALDQGLIEVTDLITSEFAEHMPVDPAAGKKPYTYYGANASFGGKGSVIVERGDRVLLADRVWLIWTDNHAALR